MNKNKIVIICIHIMYWGKIYIMYQENDRDLKSSGLLIYDLIVIFAHQVWLRSWKTLVELALFHGLTQLKIRLKLLSSSSTSFLYL